MVTLALLFGFVIGFPLATYKFLKSKRGDLSTYQRRFGSLFLNLDVDNNPKAWLFTPLFLLRRFLFAFSLNFLGTPSTQPQIYGQIAMSFGLIYYLITVKPFTEKVLN